MSQYHPVLKGFFLVGLAVLLAGCPPKQQDIAMEDEAPVEEVTEELPSLEIGQQWSVIPAFETVRFATNRSALTPASRESLKKNAALLAVLLEQAPGLQIRVEGHCDDRGTVEYNLALGQRRANAVQKYYATWGLSKSALSTVSYGEERPHCSDIGEDCWRQNRRSVTVVRSGGEPLRIPLDKLPADFQ